MFGIAVKPLDVHRMQLRSIVPNTDASCATHSILPTPTALTILVCDHNKRIAQVNSTLTWAVIRVKDNNDDIARHNSAFYGY